MGAEHVGVYKLYLSDGGEGAPTRVVIELGTIFAVFIQDKESFGTWPVEKMKREKTPSFGLPVTTKPNKQ